MKLLERVKAAEAAKLPTGSVAEVLRCRVKVITPMLGGGVHKQRSNPERPVRGKQVKAALRRWWRLLAEAGQLPGQDGQGWSGKTLYEQERLRWGGFDDDGKCPQPWVCVRVKPSSTAITRGDWDAVPRYLHGVFGQQRPATYLQGGFEFSLTIEILHIPHSHPHGAIAEEVCAALRWYGSFGGVGSRTRRGLGRVWISDCFRHSIQPDGRFEVMTLSLGPVSKDDATAAGCDLLTGKAVNAADKALADAVDALRWFRQGHPPQIAHNARKAFLTRNDRHANSADAQDRLEVQSIALGLATQQHQSAGLWHVRPLGSWGQDYRPGASRWPEWFEVEHLVSLEFQRAGDTWPHAWSLRKRPDDNGLFPRCALGMPIVASMLSVPHGKPVRGTFELKPDDADRMSSPVLIGVRATAVGSYEPYALLLPEAFRHQALSSRVEVKWTGAHAFTSNAGHPVWRVGAETNLVPMYGAVPKATDPLSGFMQFFKAWVT